MQRIALFKRCKQRIFCRLTKKLRFIFFFSPTHRSVAQQGARGKSWLFSKRLFSRSYKSINCPKNHIISAIFETFSFHSTTSFSGSKGSASSPQPKTQRRIGLNCFASKLSIKPVSVSSIV